MSARLVLVRDVGLLMAKIFHSVTTASVGALQDRLQLRRSTTSLSNNNFASFSSACLWEARQISNFGGLPRARVDFLGHRRAVSSFYSFAPEVGTGKNIAVRGPPKPQNPPLAHAEWVIMVRAISVVFVKIRSAHQWRLRQKSSLRPRRRHAGIRGNIQD
jgi:hypothetical protein